MRAPRRWSTLGLLALAGVLSTSPSAAPLGAQERYDVVLAGGRVMDPETGLDAVRNVGIRGDQVAAISAEALDGEVVVDVSGLVVAPGFVDLHVHGQTARANEFQAMDGVTTALELEGGVPDVGRFLESRRGRAVVNYGAAVAHGSVRVMAMPEMSEAVAEADAIMAAVRAEGRDPTPEENARLFRLTGEAGYEALPPERYEALRGHLDRGLAEGALGIGVPHQYYPGATRDEIFRVFEFAAERGVPIYTHVRSMGVAPIQEVLANAAATGAPLHIVHLNSSSLGDIGTNLELIQGARSRGVDVTTEVYPYTAASTGIESAIFDEGWKEALGIDEGDVQWQATGERLTPESFARYREEGGVVIIHMMKSEWIERAIAEPGVMIASDGMPYDPGAHPRSAGTFARFLGRYVRDAGAAELMEGLRRITLLPAQRLETVSTQAARKGRLQVGADADIAVFDPARIIDTATFEDELSYSEGVEFVLVNGEFVVREGALVEGARPGRAVVGRGVAY